MGTVIGSTDFFRFPRVQAPVCFRRVSGDGAPRRVGEFGIGGVRVKAEQGYQVNERLELRLSLPDGEELECLVRVAWIGGAPERGYEAGMQLLDADPARIGALLSVVQEL